MDLERSLGENLGSVFVMIRVGSANTEFVVHKNVICSASDYFAKAFRGNFQEGCGVLSLPEDSPEIISLFIGWAYSNTVLGVPTQAHFEKLFKLYAFAAKICATMLVNTTMDEIHQLACDYREPQVTTGMIEFIFKNTGPELPLRMWALKEYVSNLDPIKRSGIPDAETAKEFSKSCQENEDILLTYLEYMRSWSGKKCPYRRDGQSPGCLYHFRHDDKCICNWSLSKPLWS